MAQNLDRFHTFPRLAGGKGPSPRACPTALGTPPCPGRHERGGGGGDAPQRWGGPAGAESSFRVEALLWHLYRAFMPQSVHFFFIHSFIHPSIIQQVNY